MNPLKCYGCRHFGGAKGPDEILCLHPSMDDEDDDLMRMIDPTFAEMCADFEKKPLPANDCQVCRGNRVIDRPALPDFCLPRYGNCPKCNYDGKGGQP